MSEVKKLTDKKLYAEALPLWEVLVKRYETTKDTLSWVKSLLGMGECQYRLVQYDKSEAAFLKSVELVKSGTSLPDATLAAQAWKGYAYCLHAKNKYRQSLDAALKATEEAERVYLANDLIFGKIDHLMGNCHEKLDHQKEAEAFFKKSLAVYNSAGAGMEETYNLYLSLASFYTQQLDHDKAFAYYEKVEHWIESLKEIPSHINNAATVYLNTGHLHRLNKNYTKALEYNQKAGDVIRKRYGPYHQSVSFMNNNFGGIYLEMEQFDRAIAHLNTALTVADSIWKSPQPLRSAIKSYLAMCYAYKGNQETADYYWKKALEEAGNLESKVSLSSVYSRMADVDADLGRHESAVANYGRSLDIRRAQAGMDATVQIPSMIAISDALQKLNRNEEALTWANAALQLQIKPGIKYQHELPDSAFVMTIKTPITITARAQAFLGLWHEKRQLTMLDSAWTVVQQGLRLNDQFRRRFQRSRSENYEWLQQVRLLHALGINVAWEQYHAGAGAASLATAFQLADRSKAILLSEGAQDAAAKQFAGLPPEVLKKEEQLRRDIALYETKTFEASSQNQNSTNALYHDSLLFALKRQQEVLIYDLEQRYPRYYEHRYATPSVKVGDIQKALNSNALFIEYMLDPENKQVYIFTIDRNRGLKVNVAPLDAATNEQVRELNQLASSIFLVRKDKKARFIQLSHALYQQFLKPIESLLNGKNELIVIPDGCLNYLPFDLLLKTPTDAPFQHLPYLLRDFEVKYHYSGALFLHNAANTAPVVAGKSWSADVSGRSLLAFAPVFDHTNTTDNTNEALALRNRSTIDTTLRATFADGEFMPLPYSEREVRAIVQLFGDPKSKILLYQNADEATLKAELQKKRRIAHIATHSFANLEQPHFSGIACAQPTNSTATEDGILYVSEIYNLNIPADLVVLSSCESGLGKLAGSEGLLGLNRAFAYAGVPNIVYSLWKVNDRASSELMIEFYKQILAGKSYSAALRAAKLKMLENPTTASPNFWSGFLLMGR